MSIQGNINQMLTSGMVFTGLAYKGAEGAMTRAENKANIVRLQNPDAAEKHPMPQPHETNIVGMRSATAAYNRHASLVKSEQPYAKADNAAYAAEMGDRQADEAEISLQMAQKARKTALDEMRAKVDTTNKAADWLEAIKKGVIDIG